MSDLGRGQNHEFTNRWDQKNSNRWRIVFFCWDFAEVELSASWRAPRLESGPGLSWKIFDAFLIPKKSASSGHIHYFQFKSSKTWNLVVQRHQVLNNVGHWSLDAQSILLSPTKCFLISWIHHVSRDDNCICPFFAKKNGSNGCYQYRKHAKQVKHPAKTFLSSQNNINDVIWFWAYFITPTYISLKFFGDFPCFSYLLRAFLVVFFGRELIWPIRLAPAHGDLIRWSNLQRFTRWFWNPFCCHGKKPMVENGCFLK